MIYWYNGHPADLFRSSFFYLIFLIGLLWLSQFFTKIYRQSGDKMSLLDFWICLIRVLVCICNNYNLRLKTWFMFSQISSIETPTFCHLQIYMWKRFILAAFQKHFGIFLSNIQNRMKRFFSHLKIYLLNNWISTTTIYSRNEYMNIFLYINK
jgi:hypothetical protein